MGQIVCSNSATGLRVNGYHQETTKKESEKKNTSGLEMKEPEKKSTSSGFQMPLHYPRYKREDYEKMPEWKLDLLLKEYGLPTDVGDVNEKRKFAMGAFLWT